MLPLSTPRRSTAKRRQAFPDLVRRAEQVRLDGPDVEPGRLRDLRDRHLLEMLHDEDRPLAWRENVERLAEPLADLLPGRSALGAGGRMRGGVLRRCGVLAIPAGRLVKVHDETPPLEAVLAPVDAD